MYVLIKKNIFTAEYVNENKFLTKSAVNQFDNHVILTRTIKNFLVKISI